MNPQNHSSSFDPKQFERPSKALLTYYFLTSLLTGPGIFFALPAFWFRYSTLQYRFEETGLRMKVGVLFRKEVITAYRRIQDIHVTSNLFQRWLGIASVSIQTASGSAMPEIILEGVTNPESMRDWLYERLRGAKGQSQSPSGESSNQSVMSAGSSDEVAQLLREIRDNLSVVANAARSGRKQS